jgi:hypothetical protein
MNKMLLIAGALSLTAVAAQAQPVQDEVTGADYCREYNQTLTIAGKTQKGYGMACLQPDGSWELQRTETHTNTNVNQAYDNAPPPAPNMEYYVEESHVYVTPPEPFVVGTVFIGGHERHFDRGFHPYYHGGYNHWR